MKSYEDYFRLALAEDLEGITERQTIAEEAKEGRIDYVESKLMNYAHVLVPQLRMLGSIDFAKEDVAEEREEYKNKFLKKCRVFELARYAQTAVEDMKTVKKLNKAISEVEGLLDNPSTILLINKIWDTILQPDNDLLSNRVSYGLIEAFGERYRNTSECYQSYFKRDDGTCVKLADGALINLDAMVDKMLAKGKTTVNQDDVYDIHKALQQLSAYKPPRHANIPHLYTRLVTCVTIIAEHYYHDATKFFSASDTYKKNANEILVKAKKEVIEVLEEYNGIADMIGGEFGLKGYKKEILTLDNHVLDLVRKYAFILDDARVRNEREKLLGFHELFQRELQYTSIEDVWQVGLDRKSNWRPVTDTYKIRGE